MLNSTMYWLFFLMSKPLEAEKQGLDSPSEHTDTERNGPDTNHQNPQNKTSPFSVSPTGPSTKIKAEDPSGDSAPAAPPPPQPAQPHLPQAQLMLTGSQLAGVKSGRASPQEKEVGPVA
uniref:POU class 2 homeobox 2 n=1 Tax=Canis lupus dingo TaxID=286419 RepID=A0A8C0KR54_CANLU